MITFKIQGVDEVVRGLRNAKLDLPAELIDKAVLKVAEPLRDSLKQAYITKGHNKTGDLVKSIQAFRRKRKSRNDPFFTYYVGPKYGPSGKGSNKSRGGNAAHLLEYGTAERYRANVKAGGVGKKQGLSKVYGAKYETGKVDATGVIRRTYDEKKDIMTMNLKKLTFDAIMEGWENRGGKFFKK